MEAHELTQNSLVCETKERRKKEINVLNIIIVVDPRFRIESKRREDKKIECD